ncbi:MAG: UDP-3-O-acyl-N-acetylglucosamine deacetylase [Gemmatimonadetes bacterium]|nr:UDP-3-O-acyl-N-acetylglucosamine deacetylase [Gemmatimonadota bacterium]
MPAPRRASIARPVSLRGVGLHTGAPVTLTFRPTESGQGVFFRRSDIASAPRIPATVEAVRVSDRRTVLCADGVTVDTVEHVLAAVAGHEIDDLCIELGGPEPPILDGSAGPFFESLAEAGRVEGAGAASQFTLTGPIEVREGEAEYHAGPGERSITVQVHWDHPVIGTQRGAYAVSPRAFGEHLAFARTFGFLRELDELRRRGLIRGASPGCAVVLSDTAVVGGALRWKDEFVRHKALDLVGDLALLGGRVDGSIEASRPSHRGNIALARAIKQHCSSER